MKKVKWVQGNTLPMAVPLYELVIDGQGQISRTAYTPPAGSCIEVRLVGGFKSIRYEHTLGGNCVFFTDSGTLPCGSYGVEIDVKEPNRNLRTFKCHQIEIVESSDGLEIGEILTDGAAVLDAGFFVKCLPGSNGITPHIDPDTKHWMIGDVDTGICAEQLQADWNQNDTTAKDFIKNKPAIPTIPQNVSSFANDAGFITKFVADLVNYYSKQEVFTKSEVMSLLSALNLGGDAPSSVSIDCIVDVEEDGFFIVDEQGNVGAKLTDDGFRAIGDVDVCDFVPKPTRIVRIDFYTDDTLPTSKNENNPILAYGRIKVNFDGIEIYKFATLEVQGASSARYPKKNWSFAFFNDDEYTEEYEFRIGDLVPLSEYVFKANWIDATHCRNIVSNRIWEQFVQSREGYPKREFEVAYEETETDMVKRVDVGALGHVEGFPCVMYINDSFYGIGDFNIGKKRANYNLDKSSATQVQMQAEQHIDFLNFQKSSTYWEVRNPKNGTFDSVESVVTPWFASNDPTDADFKTNFPTTHNLQNAIDYLIFIEFIYADDCVDKNFQLTTWDGTVFSFMPYDLDTTFNLWWDGTKYTNPVDPSVVHSTNNVTQSAMDFWDGFLDAYRTEIVARYNELKSKGIISVDNIYNLCNELTRKYGKDLFKKEQKKWTTIPSNTNIHTSVPQILDWVEDRITWMDTHFTNNN